MITIVLGLQMGGFQLALLSAVNELGLDGKTMGLPVTAQFLSISLMPLIFGPISDRVGKMKIVAVFMFVFSLGCFLAWMSSSAGELIIAAFIIGAGFSVCECSGAAAISDVFLEDGEKYINFCQSFFCIGAVLSPILLQALIDNYSASWRIIFLICAIVMAAIVPAVLSVHTNPVRKAEQKQADRKKGNPLMFIGFVLCMFIYVGIESCLAYFADTVLTLEMSAPAFGAFAISLFWGAMGIGRFFFGRLKIIPRSATAVSLLCLAAIMACIIFINSEYTMLIFFTVCGFACSCIWPGIINSAVSLNRDSSGAIVSYLNLGAGLGGAVFPLVLGVLLTVTGISVSFIILAVFPVMAGVYLLKKVRKTSSI